MNKRKIFNDPVYGFIRFPYESVYEVINHPYFQRLRRITQLGLSHYIYPGAIHSRFQHAIGATHLMCKAIDTLKDKGVDISKKEAEAVCLAILLHDIGHGPFSHALEYKIIPLHHEGLSLMLMKDLNKQMKGQLNLALDIFEKKYNRPFLNQLVSSQLDMDRMDYLNRDSFFTGVAEGIIGYDRIIKMFNVRDGNLVIEEKGIYSIEKFLMARRIMYWQVYLHKTVMAVEKMLVLFFQHFKQCWDNEHPIHITHALRFFLENSQDSLQKDVISNFALLDDYDIISCLKLCLNHPDYTLRYLAQAILNRQLFKIRITDQEISKKTVDQTIQSLSTAMQIDMKIASKLIIVDRESNLSYNNKTDEIMMLMKNGSVRSFSTVSDYKIDTVSIEKHIFCYPSICMPEF